MKAVNSYFHSFFLKRPKGLKNPLLKQAIHKHGTLNIAVNKVEPMKFHKLEVTLMIIIPSSALQAPLHAKC